MTETRRRFHGGALRRLLLVGVGALTAVTALTGTSSAAPAAKPAPVSIATTAASASIPDGYYQIRSLYGNGGQCLDADLNGGGANGTKVQLWDCNGSTQQTWYKHDGVLWNLLWPSMCLDADLNGGGANGTKLQLWTCNGTDQQYWLTVPGDKALYNARFYNNGNTVVDRDIFGGAGNGDKAQLWQKNGQWQQWWTFEHPW